MLSHDGWGGMRIALNLLDSGANLVLEEYGMTIEHDDRWKSVKLYGPCMAILVLREAEEVRLAKQQAECQPACYTRPIEPN